MGMSIVDITTDEGTLAEPGWLARAEEVHRELRPQLPEEYVEKMQRVFAGGARMSVAVDDDAVLGVAVWRVYEDTSIGRKLYVDDLVTTESARSEGVGQTLLTWLEARARKLDCRALTLDSGVQRARAHRFYFREGLSVFAFNFRRDL